jgi:type IV secretion system protein TrbD
MERAREVMIHQSANRPNLLLGCDREMVLFAGLMSAILVFALANWWGVLIGVSLWIASVAVLSRVGKSDPLMRKVYLRHVRYQSHYPASPRPTGMTLMYPNKW